MEDKMVKVELGVQFRLGEYAQATGRMDAAIWKLFDLSGYRYIRIEVDENLPCAETMSGKFERRKRMYRAEIPESKVQAIIDLIPKENPYGIYLKRI